MAGNLVILWPYSDRWPFTFFWSWWFSGTHRISPIYWKVCSRWKECWICFYFGWTLKPKNWCWSGISMSQNTWSASLAPLFQKVSGLGNSSHPSPWQPDSATTTGRSNFCIVTGIFLSERCCIRPATWDCCCWPTVCWESVFTIIFVSDGGDPQRLPSEGFSLRFIQVPFRTISSLWPSLSWTPSGFAIVFHHFSPVFGWPCWEHPYWTCSNFDWASRCFSQNQFWSRGQADSYWSVEPLQNLNPSMQTPAQVSFSFLDCSATYMTAAIASLS